MRLLLILVLSSQLLHAEDKPAYRIFDSRGKEVSFSKMCRELQDADLVFFGELHNNAIAHWMELQVEKELYAGHKDNLVLGAEMFEADNQYLINEYLQGMVTDKRFEEEARLWKNYSTDYKPLLLFAKQNGLHFVATNVPRHYAGLVSDRGFEALQSVTPEGRKFLPPFPIPYDSTLSCYHDMLEMGGMHGGKVNANFPKAQALKDATMAHFILQNWSRGKIFLHFNGSYHSDKHQGIVWYVQQAVPSARILTVTVVSQAEITDLKDEAKGLADYIIVVPEDMTNTY